MDRGPTGLEVTRRHLPRLVGGLAVLVGFRSALSQPMAQPFEKKTTMRIDRNGSRPSTKGAQDYFSGSVRVEPVFQVGEPMRLNAGSVTFEPGARTAWHTHPLGHRRSRLGANRRWSNRGSPSGRRGVVSARRETLARRNAHYRDDAYCGSGIAQWQEC